MSLSSAVPGSPATTKSWGELIVPGLFGAVVLALGVWVALVEIGPYVAPDRAPGAEDDLTHGWAMPSSISGQELALFDCREAMTSIAGRTQPSTLRHKVIANCQAMSTELVTSEPSFSVAWLTGAIAAAERDDWRSFNTQLVRSQVTGRIEQWIAEMRVALAEQHFDHLSSIAAEGETQDLKLLIESDHGIASIANRYIEDLPFRDRLATVLETMPVSDQNHFIRTLRQLVKERRQ